MLSEAFSKRLIFLQFDEESISTDSKDSQTSTTLWEKLHQKSPLYLKLNTDLTEFINQSIVIL